MVEQRDESRHRLGITEQDMERIENFLGKRQYERSIDDLRPSSDD